MFLLIIKFKKMRVSKADKMGSYLCRIGGYDVRQKITLPKSIKGYGGVQNTKGDTEGRIYKGKRLIEAKLPSAWAAVKKAYKLACREGNAKDVPAKIRERYNLSCD